MEGLFGVVILFVVVVLILRAKSNYADAHPDTCDICGNKEPMAIGLKDGHMCYKCAKVKYMYRTIDLAHVMEDSDFKKYTVAEMKSYIETIRHRGELMASFHPTRTSEDGIIQYDEKLDLFIVGNEQDTFAHSPADVESFKIVIDKDYINPSDSILIEGGHIAIKLKEPVKEISISYGSKRDSFGARHEVKKALEPDIEFLEEITSHKF